MQNGASQVEFPCPLCGKGLAAPASAAGRRMVCPACEGMTVVPAPRQAQGGVGAALCGRSLPARGHIRNGMCPQRAPARASAEGAHAGAPLPANAAAAPVSRVCPRCGKTVHLDASYAGRQAKCTYCWATVEPGSGEVVAEVEYVDRPYPLAKAAGWTVSLVLHLLLFLGLTGATWLSGLGTGDGEAEVDIGNAGGDDSAKLDQSPAGAVELQPDAEKPVDLSVAAEETPVDAVADIAVSAAASAPADVVGISDGVGGRTAPGANMTGLPGGSGGAASFFGLGARGNSFVYVVDYSGSMYVFGKIEAAKNELLRSMQALSGSQRFHIIFFDSRHEPMPAQALVPATAANKQTFGRWVEQARGGGGTNPMEAMELALSLKPNAIWLMTDGMFECSDDAILGLIRANNPGRRIQVHAIAFFENAGEPILKRIAEENRGKYRFVPPAAIGPAGGAPRGVPVGPRRPFPVPFRRP